jgi:hypothetical protein
MKSTLIKEYWVLTDKEKEFFLTEDDDWTPLIYQAAKFPDERGANMYNESRSYDLVEKNEVRPAKVKVTYEVE